MFFRYNKIMYMLCQLGSQKPMFLPVKKRERATAFLRKGFFTFRGRQYRTISLVPDGEKQAWESFFSVFWPDNYSQLKMNVDIFRSTGKWPT